MDRFTRFWQNLPLGSKLASLASLLVVGVVLALTTLAIQREQATFRQEMESQANLLLETLPLTMRDQLYRLQIDELEDIAGVVGDNENVTLLKVYDSEGALLVDASLSHPAFAQVVEPLGETLIASGRDQIVLDWQADQLVAGRSIWLGNQRIGAVAVGLSTAPLDAKIAALTYQSIAIALITLGVGVGLAFLLARHIATPLSDLTDLAAQMAAGKLDTRMKRVSEDEVGQLSSAFNQMADAIQKRETDLRDLATGLELAVKARTAELREQNEALVQANEELRIARSQAEEATRLKSQFLATVSHELRTPLNAIMGFSQLLLAGTSGPMVEPQEEKVKRILKNAQNLLDLINDLLDLAKIEAGRTELISKPFAVGAWLGEIAQQFEGLAREKGLDFTTTLDERLPEMIVGDPTRLKQIVANLLSNAIKFTEKGNISIDVRKQSDDIWAIAVKDTGVGIPSHAQEYIFEEFRQVDSSPQRKHGGTGLGLAIVRNLAVMMGGTIRVKSTVGEGSTFTVLLPLVTQKVKGG